MNEPIEPDRPDAEASPDGPSEGEIADISRQSPKSRWAALEVLGVALRLGLTSFGGPIAHLGYFREEYVVQRRWLDETSYADVVALCQFLPGPASSQVGIAIGYIRAGMAGGLAAWIGFTLPSALALVMFAYGVEEFDVIDAGWLHGLKLAAVAVVAQAVWGMGRSLALDRDRATIVIVAAVAALAWQSAIMQVLIILVSGFVGWKILKVDAVQSSKDSLSTFIPKWMGIVALVVFFVILAGLPLARQLESSQTLAIFDSFFRSGSLVFGGGHVVLPLLQSEVVGPGWMTNAEFVAGRSNTGCTRPPVHLQRLSRRSNQSGAARYRRRRAGSGRDIPTLVPADNRSPAILGPLTQARRLSTSLEWSQRRSSGTTARRPLRSGLDQRGRNARGLCLGR